jgi:hypothetical protein
MKASNIIKNAIKDNLIKVSNVKKIKKQNDIKRIGICVTQHYQHKRKIKDMIFMLKEKFNDKFEIVTTGDTKSYEKFVKNYAIQFDCEYKEFLPSHYQKTLYSVMPMSFYGKEYSPKNFFIRDLHFAKYVDYLMVFEDAKDKEERQNIIKNVQKLQKEIIIIV